MIEPEDIKDGEEPDIAVTEPDAKIESALDEDGEIDYDTSQAAYDLAKKEDLGITSDREIDSVVRDED
ncbi:MAG: hypothetical protein ACYS7Y_29020, partial [Planctomycetota bacterium]